MDDRLSEESLQFFCSFLGIIFGEKGINDQKAPAGGAFDHLNCQHTGENFDQNILRGYMTIDGFGIN